jgi:hypothetical protein
MEERRTNIDIAESRLEGDDWCYRHDCSLFNVPNEERGIVLFIFGSAQKHAGFLKQLWYDATREGWMEKRAMRLR